MGLKALTLRIRDAVPGESVPDMKQHQVVEVLDGGQPVGQLLMSEVTYNMVHNRRSSVSLTFTGAGAEFMTT